MELSAIGNVNYNADPQQEAKAIAKQEEQKKEQAKAAEKRKEEEQYNAMSPEDRAALAAAPHAIGEAIAMSIISGVIG